MLHSPPLPVPRNGWTSWHCRESHTGPHSHPATLGPPGTLAAGPAWKPVACEPDGKWNGKYFHTYQEKAKWKRNETVNTFFFLPFSFFSFTGKWKKTANTFTLTKKRRSEKEMKW